MATSAKEGAIIGAYSLGKAQEVIATANLGGVTPVVSDVVASVSDIYKRLGDNSIGFNTNLNNKDKVNESTIFDNVEPKDLRRYGLIPEFIGRLPVVTSVNELDKDALIKILVEPKNAITKQFKKIFELDDVELTFTDGALEAMAELALERKTGARGLRSIIEKLLLDEMFEAPSRKDIEKIIIDKENVVDDIQPKMVLKQSKDKKDSKPA